jgi:UDP-N-acetylmuramoyl-tripeptide--D-alanyl-D-alanine ligase
MSSEVSPEIQEILNAITRGGCVSIDSRTTNPGDVFFAIGCGHQFVQEAIENGAAIAVVSESQNLGNCIVVENTLETLLDVGQIIKNFSKAKIIGITGSVGKTTTKSWLSEVLSQKYRVLAGIKNYNTIFGLPICLSKLQKDHDFGIFEIGTNKRGEVNQLVDYLNPDVSIITNIFESHIGMFGSLKAVAEEKMDIIKNQKIVFHGDSIFRDAILSKTKESVSYGFDPHNDFVVGNYFGKNANHYDFIKTCIMATLYILEQDVNEYDLSGLMPLPGRGKIYQCSYNNKNFSVIDDSYNASPSSMKSSLSMLKSAKKYKQKIAILGEMKELGEFSEQYHFEIAKIVKNYKFDKTVFVGAQNVSKFFENSFPSVDEIDVANILDLIKNEAIVLLKGSRSVRLDKVLNVLQSII